MKFIFLYICWLFVASSNQHTSSCSILILHWKNNNKKNGYSQCVIWVCARFIFMFLVLFHFRKYNNNNNTYFLSSVLITSHAPNNDVRWKGQKKKNTFLPAIFFSSSWLLLKFFFFLRDLFKIFLFCFLFKLNYGTQKNRKKQIRFND